MAATALSFLAFLMRSSFIMKVSPMTPPRKGSSAGALSSGLPESLMWATTVLVSPAAPAVCKGKATATTARAGISQARGANMRVLLFGGAGIELFHVLRSLGEGRGGVKKSDRGVKWYCRLRRCREECNAASGKRN